MTNILIWIAQGCKLYTKGTEKSRDHETLPFPVFKGNPKMSFKNLLVLFSCVVGAAALLLCLDIFKPQREQLISLLPANLKDRVFGDLGATPKDRLFTLNELERYRGQVYLAILGQVFDVTKGSKHYRPGGTYHFFTGE